MEAKNLPKKTKRTQLWITLSTLSLPVLPAVSLSNRACRSVEGLVGRIDLIQFTRWIRPRPAPASWGVKSF
jgi:hypothetical protein